jgi:hypothetical protein
MNISRFARIRAAVAALALTVAAVSAAHAQVAGAITVYPTTSSLDITSTLQFTAYVPISPNTVTWLVNNVPGGSSTIGTITPAGLYTPPTVISGEQRRHGLGSEHGVPGADWQRDADGHAALSLAVEWIAFVRHGRQLQDHIQRRELRA